MAMSLTETGPKNVTSSDEIHDVLTRANDLTQRVEQLVGRLIGFQPTEANINDMKASIGSDAVIPSLVRHAQQVAEAIASAESELARLSRTI
ncbi:hypothetical protein EVB91_217 [Rhizobium phage RHph_I1_18]|nr:hypothetical protein EVB91_217 [Rhizobium phage RHph_I1_18]